MLGSVSTQIHEVTGAVRTAVGNLKGQYEKLDDLEKKADNILEMGKDFEKAVADSSPTPKSEFCVKYKSAIFTCAIGLLIGFIMAGLILRL